MNLHFPWKDTRSFTVSVKSQAKQLARQKAMLDLKYSDVSFKFERKKGLFSLLFYNSSSWVDTHHTWDDTTTKYKTSWCITKPYAVLLSVSQKLGQHHSSVGSFVSARARITVCAQGRGAITQGWRGWGQEGVKRKGDLVVPITSHNIFFFKTLALSPWRN